MSANKDDMKANEMLFDFDYKSIVRSGADNQTVGNGQQIQTYEEYYDSFEMDSELWFVCNLCEQTERHKTEITEHLRQHFEANTSNTCQTRIDNKNKVFIDLNDSLTDESDNQLVDDIQCQPMASVDRQTHQVNNGPKTGKQTSPTTSAGVVSNWEEWVDVRDINGKENLFCKYSNDCSFWTDLRIKIKQHICKHLNRSPKRSTVESIPRAPEPIQEPKPKPKPQSESEYWDKILADVPKGPKPGPVILAERTQPRDRPLVASTPEPKPNDAINWNHSSADGMVRNGWTYPYAIAKAGNKIETKASPLIAMNVDLNNASLSLKGLQSASKLKKYIERRVENGMKVYYCKYNNVCQFRNTNSQHIARHIHCQHIGIYLKCIRPGCDKVFRTPNSWREHQKNHICNYGIYGYQRNVVGVCRNDNLNKYKEAFVLNGQRGFRCKWKDCSFQTLCRSVIKPHIHSQHVCPFRRTSEWKDQLKQSIQYSAQMPELGDIPLDAMVPIDDNKNFFCRRRECKSHFSNETDLRKHENLWCKYRPSVRRAKSGTSSQSKSGTSSQSKSKHKVKSIQSKRFDNRNKDLNKSKEKSKEMQRKENKIRKERDGNGSQNMDLNRSQNMDLNESQNMDVNRSANKPELNELIELKVFEGVDYYLCKWKDCKFVTKITDKIDKHLEEQHCLSKRIANKSKNDIESQRESRKRKHSAPDATVKKSESNPYKRHNNEINSERSHSQKSNTVPNKKPKANAGAAQVAYEKKSIDGEPNYFCKHSNECKYYTNSIKDIESHFRETHVFFRCNAQKCDKAFKTVNLLSVHKRNHICGFGIKGRKPEGMCDLDNIRRFKKEKLRGKEYVSQCLWPQCKYVSEIRSQCLSHIHNRHICPNRHQI